jgi:AhpD family alkylhydroperoxidase
MIATFVSQQNACPYCADSHAVLLGAHGGSAELICALQDADLNSQVCTSAELALLKFAAKVNTNSPAITRADVETAMHAGWTEAQVAEAVHIAALFVTSRHGRLRSPEQSAQSTDRPGRSSLPVEQAPASVLSATPEAPPRASSKAASTYPTGKTLPYQHHSPLVHPH